MAELTLAYKARSFSPVPVSVLKIRAMFRGGMRC